MQTRGMFKSLGTRTIGGKLVAVAEHKLMKYYRIGTCNIPAMSIDEAIEKYLTCQERAAK